MTAKKVKITEDDVLKVVIADLQERLNDSLTVGRKLQVERDNIKNELNRSNDIIESIQKECKALFESRNFQAEKWETEFKIQIEEKLKLNVDMVELQEKSRDLMVSAKAEMESEIKAREVVIDRLRIAEKVSGDIRADHIKQIQQLQSELRDKQFIKSNCDRLEAEKKMMVLQMDGFRDENKRLSDHYKAIVMDLDQDVIKARIRGNYKSLFWGTMMLLAGYLIAIGVHYLHAH